MCQRDQHAASAFLAFPNGRGLTPSVARRRDSSRALAGSGNAAQYWDPSRAQRPVPFTVSHTAAAAVVWPAARRVRVPLCALVIGTMVPDFEYFLHLRPLARWSHSATGLLTFCLPVGLVVLALWRAIRVPVRDLLLVRDEAPDEPTTARWWLAAAIGIVAGAVTHLVWDGLTHPGRWGTRLLPFLERGVIAVAHRPMSVAAVLDHASTIVGGLVVLAWLGRKVGDAPRGWRLGVLAAMAGVALAGATWNAALAPMGSGYWAAELTVARGAVGGMMGLGVALLGFGAWRRATSRTGAGGARGAWP